MQQGITIVTLGAGGRERWLPHATGTAVISSASPLVRKLRSVITLSAEEEEVLAKLPMQVASFGADQDIVREGDRPSRSFVLLEGFAITYSIIGDGKRQIMAFHIAGDMPDLQSLHLEVLDNSVGTITPCKVGFVQHDVLWAISSSTRASPRPCGARR